MHGQDGYDSCPKVSRAEVETVTLVAAQAMYCTSSATTAATSSPPLQQLKLQRSLDLG